MSCHWIITALPCATFSSASCLKHFATLDDFADACGPLFIAASRCSLVQSLPQSTRHPLVAYWNKVSWAGWWLMLESSLICLQKTGEYLLWNGVTLSDPCAMTIVLLLFGLPFWLVVVLFCWFSGGSLIPVNLSFGCVVFIQLGMNIWSVSFSFSMCLPFVKCWFFCFLLGGGWWYVLRHFLCSFCHCLSIVFIWEQLLRVVFGFTCCSHAFGAQNGSLSWHIHSCGDFALAIFFSPSTKKVLASVAWFWSSGELSWFSLHFTSPQPPHRVYWAHLAGWSPMAFNSDATSCLFAFANWPKCVLPFFSMISCLAAFREVWKTLF